MKRVLTALYKEVWGNRQLPWTERPPTGFVIS